MNYKQMEFDVRLDSERNLKENVMVAVDFACKQLGAEALPVVSSRHEGYGIAAESWTDLTDAVNKVKDGMKTFLRVLPAEDADAINSASSLYNSACEVAYEAVRMAAQTNRIMNDLYRGLSEERTPLEEYLDNVDSDGFQEADETEDEDND